MPKIVDHDQRRSSIAEAASAVIADKGIEGAKLVDIGRKAGVTTGAIGHYFSDKASLLSAALEWSYQDTLTRIDNLKKQPSYQLIDVLMADLPTDAASRQAKSVWLAFWSRAIAEPTIAAHQQTIHAHWISVVNEEIDRQRRHFAELPPNLAPTQAAPVAELAETVTAFVNGLIIRALVSPEQWQAQTLYRQLNRFLQPYQLDFIASKTNSK